MQLSTRAATELVGQLSHTEEIKGAIRDNGGILALMRSASFMSNMNTSSTLKLPYDMPRIQTVTCCLCNIS